MLWARIPGLLALSVDSRVLALIDAHAAGRGKIENRVIASMVAMWSRFDAWYRPRLVEEVADESFRLVAAGQVATAGLTDSYMGGVASTLARKQISPIGVDPSMRGSLREGVSGREVQARVAQEFRWQIYRGALPDDAMGTALARAQASVSQDLSLASRGQARSFMRRRGVTHYRRVTRGEKTCGLCGAASNQEYTREDLLPIHANCRCSVVPVGASFPGAPTTDEDYRKLAGVTRSSSAKDLKDVRYVIDEHGELGPVLRNANQRVSGVSPATGRVQSKGGRTPEQKRIPVDSGIAGMSPERAQTVIARHEKALAWSTRQGLDEQVAYHAERVRLLRAHLDASTK